MCIRDRFKLQFAALKDIGLKEVLSVNSSITVNEAYQAELLKAVELEFEKDNPIFDRFILMQNEPNPFMEETMIGFQLPESTEATLTIFDVTGRALWTQTKAYEPGIHRVVIENDKLQDAGIYYYQLSTGKRSASKKMIMVK